MRALILTVLTAATLMLTSCASAPPTSQVRFADADLYGVVRVELPALVRNEANLLVVSVPIQNTSDEDVQLWWQVAFKDALGNRYNDETPRQPMMLARGQSAELRAISALSKANDFVATIWMSR